MNPYTHQAKRFKTDSVNGSPYSYLSSLNVIKGGRCYATNFKKIKKLKDAVKYHDDSLKEKKIYKQ